MKNYNYLADSNSHYAIAREMIQAALKAVDPAKAIKKYFTQHPEIKTQIRDRPGRLIVVGAGKATAPMARAISEIFEITLGHIIVKYGHTVEETQATSALQIVEAGHPIPDEAGLQASQKIVQRVTEAEEEDTIICLISGGGSALLTLPAENISLSDLQTTTEILLAAGATINQINTIRKHLSKVKGGGLARCAIPAKVYTLILSDVVGDPLEVIASGPTAPDPTTFADAWAIVEQYQLQSRLPSPVIKRLQAGCEGSLPETPKPNEAIFKKVHNVIIGNNRLAAEAALKTAQQNGFEAQLLTTYIEGEARELGKMMAGLAKGLARKESSLSLPACFILGGETTVTLRGEGLGGRNQEMALAAAIALEDWADDSDLLIACLGTDGNDGPTDAAGAFADSHTVHQARKKGLEAIDYLNRNDSYHFFQAIETLIQTGPTNTNVNDLIFIFAR